jgi:6-phosphofructokinase 1
MIHILKDRNLQVEQLGTPEFISPQTHHIKSGIKRLHFTSDDERVYLDINVGSPTHDDKISFERAGAREKIYFNPETTRVAVVTCGGLCPGLNDVIRALVMELHYWYDVEDILAIKYGYSGFLEDTINPPVQLTIQDVLDIHVKGGTVFGSSRGAPSNEEIVDSLTRLGINILFCIGGDGTLRGAHAISEEIEKRGLKISVVGIPKTIDNDIPCVYRSFGFQTAVEEARKVLDCAHVEATGAFNGLGLVKLMGRDAGFVAALAARASGDANYCLIPEIEFPLEGENGLLQHLRERMKNRHHALVVVAEGAGQHLIGRADAKDESGNVLYKDIGLFLKDKIKQAFKEWNEEIHIKYFDPSYILRSVPANSEDSIFCADLARFAVDAAMAGKTDMMVGFWHGEFTHVPLDAIHNIKKKVRPGQMLWRSVLQTTGQPANW